MSGCQEYYESKYDLIADVCDYRRPGGWKKPANSAEAINNIYLDEDCGDAIDSLFSWEDWEGHENDRRGIVQALQVIAAYPMRYGKTFLGLDKGEIDVNFVCTLFPQWEEACLKTAWMPRAKNANRNLFDFIAHQIDVFRMKVPNDSSPNASQSDDRPNSHAINLYEGRVFSVEEDDVGRDFQSPFIVAKLLAHESFHARGDYHHLRCDYSADGIVPGVSQNELGDACDAHMRGPYGFQLFVMQSFVLGAYGKEENGRPIMSDFDLDQIAVNTCDTLARKINRFSPDLREEVARLYDSELDIIDCTLADRDWLLNLLKADIEEGAK